MEQNFQNNNLEQDFIDLNLDERPFYKKFFDFLVNPTFLFLILGILFIGFLFFSGMAIFKSVVNPSNENSNTENPIIVVNPEEEDKPKIHINNDFGFRIQFPSDSYLLENKQANPAVFTITNIPDYSESMDNSISDGYVFKVLVYKDLSYDIANIVQQKRDAFSFTKCDSDFNISNVTRLRIDGREASSFDVTNCPSNFSEYFVSTNNNVYELVKVYSGNLGFKERYKLITDEILTTFEFIDPEVESLPFTEVVEENIDSVITYRHPNLTPCCQYLEQPPFKVSKTLGVYSAQEIDKGIGIYLVNASSDQSVSGREEQLKKNLLDNYKIVTETAPEPEEEEVVLGKNEISATKLINYAWWGDVYIVNVADSALLVITVEDDVLEQEPEIFNYIIESLEIS
jgi:hypothetical protein